jgi:hypothetical protein
VEVGADRSSTGADRRLGVMQFEISVRRVAWVLGIATVILGVAHFALAHRDSPIWRLANLDAEASFGTWFASASAVLAGSLGFLFAVDARRRGATWIWWAALGVAMITLGVDEVAQVHEGVASRLGGQLRGAEETSMAGTPILGLLVLPFMLLNMWGVWKIATRRAALLIIVGLAVAWLGGFGVEELEYLNHLGSLSFTEGMAREEGDFILVGIQEILELTGVVLILVGLLRQFVDTRRSVSFTMIDNGATRPGAR